MPEFPELEQKGQMQHLIDSFRYKLPFVIAGFASMTLSVYLYFVQDEQTAAIFVGLWVPSIHSLGTLLLSADPKHVTSDDHGPRGLDVADRSVRQESRS